MIILSYKQNKFELFIKMFYVFFGTPCNLIKVCMCLCVYGGEGRCKCEIIICMLNIFGNVQHFLSLSASSPAQNPPPGLSLKKIKRNCG